MQPHRDPGYALLFQGSFVLQNAPWGTLDLSEIESHPHPLELHTSQLDLELDIREEEQQLTGILTYNSDLFRRETIKSWANQFITLVETFLQGQLKSFGAGEGLDFVHLCSLARGWAALKDACEIDDEIAVAILGKIERYRSADGGNNAISARKDGTAYGAFLAMGAYQD